MGFSSNGDAFDVRNLYPTLTLTAIDEVRDDKRKWKPERNLAFSRFTSIGFVAKARPFLRKFVEEGKLFQYVDTVLTVDHEVAKKIAFTALAEFETRILVLPVVGKDQHTNQLYEGVAICIRDMSNHVVLTYEEFASFVKYLSEFNFDMMALSLLNVAVSANGATNMENSSIVLAPNNTDYIAPIVTKRNTIPDELK